MGISAKRLNRTTPWAAAVALATIAVLCIWSRSAVNAESGSDIPKPKGEVVLTVTGQIGRTNAPGRAEFDWDMLKTFDIKTLNTSTPWTNGTPVFKGVLVLDLLEHLSAEGTTVRAIALNDYIHDIPISDFRRYPVLIAYEMNGLPLKRRDKGPLWLVFPLDHHAELRNRATERKMVWQLIELQVK